MIKQYVINYETEKRATVYASNPYRPYLETAVNELTI